MLEVLEVISWAHGLVLLVVLELVILEIFELIMLEVLELVILEVLEVISWAHGLVLLVVLELVSGDSGFLEIVIPLTLELVSSLLELLKFVLALRELELVILEVLEVI